MATDNGRPAEHRPSMSHPSAAGICTRIDSSTPDDDRQGIRQAAHFNADDLVDVRFPTTLSSAAFGLTACIERADLRPCDQQV